MNHPKQQKKNHETQIFFTRLICPLKKYNQTKEAFEALNPNTRQKLSGTKN